MSLILYGCTLRIIVCILGENTNTHTHREREKERETTLDQNIKSQTFHKTYISTNLYIP